MAGELRGEISALAKDIGPMFKQFRPKPPPQAAPKPEPIEELMNMPFQQRQELALQLGPQEYHKRVMDTINHAVETKGADARGLYAYFAGDAPIEQPSADPLSGVDEALVAELNGLVKGATDNA